MTLDEIRAKWLADIAELQKEINWLKADKETSAVSAKTYEEKLNANEIEIAKLAEGIKTIDIKITERKGGKNEEADNFGFRSLSEQAFAVAKWREDGGAMDSRLEKSFRRKAAGTGPDGLSGPAGAFLMAPQWSNELLSMIPLNFPIIGRTKPIALRQGNTIKMPALVSYDESTNTYYNGIAVYRRAEKTQFTGSTPAWAEIELKCEELIGMTAPTNEMMRRTPEAVGTLLQQMFLYAIGKTITKEIIKGTGAGGQFSGLITAECRFAMTLESNQTRSVDKILPQNLTHMMEHLTDDATAPCWIIHPMMSTELTFASATIGLGGQLMNWYDPKSSTLLGFPVFKSFACSAPGTEGDIILTDLGMYLRAFESDGDQWDASEHFYFDYNQTAFRIVVSNDGQPWWMSTKLEEDAATYTSPIVTLATS